jgi:nucleotide-binding universal stress UspA family protein
VNVLIATDGSKDATTALRTADRRLSPNDRHMHLLCVALKHPERTRSQAGSKAYERSAMREMAQILERARAILPPDSGTVNMRMEIGSPASVIVSRAEDHDLTVVGTKQREVAVTGLGPVASRVAEHAMAPVLVARPLRSEENVRVLIAVDGSAASRRAVETLRSFFDLRSAEVCLMHVAETPWIESAPDEDWVTYSDEDKEYSDVGALEKEMNREGDAIVELTRDLLRSQRVSVNVRIDEGDPANEIISEAERGQYDLVVVGATGVRDLKHRMLGSVSSKIAWNAPCSVLIVREV